MSQTARLHWASGSNKLSSAIFSYLLEASHLFKVATQIWSKLAGDLRYIRNL